jgi:general secretion pathway protein B
MSYILDALRRADSERGRGEVPSIYSQAEPATASAGGAARGRNTPLVWAVVLLSLAVIGMLVWVVRGREASPVVVAASPPVPAPAPSDSARPSPTVTAPAPAPIQAAAPAPTPLPPPTAAAPAPQQPKPVPTRKPLSPAQAQAPTLAQASKSSGPGAAPTPSAASEPRVYAVSELPDDVRRALPQLAVGGAMYSATAANRMLIINGQVMHEGDKVAPDLVLEQIKLRSAVLRYKNYRYGITY